MACLRIAVNSLEGNSTVRTTAASTFEVDMNTFAGSTSSVVIVVRLIDF